MDEPLDESEFELVMSDSSGSSASSVASTPQEKQKEEGVTIQCPICLDSTVAEMKAQKKRLYSTHCGHLFCRLCIKKTVAENKKCPTCSGFLGFKRIHPVFL